MKTYSGKLEDMIMKKIIDGKMYNTETAKVLGMGESDCGQTDTRWFEEHLYKKKNR